MILKVAKKYFCFLKYFDSDLLKTSILFGRLFLIQNNKLQTTSAHECAIKIYKS